MRSKTGFTLMELLIATIMASIVLMAATGIILTEYNNCAIITDTIRAGREALLLTNHMSNVLRYASDIQVNPGPPLQISATIPLTNRPTFLPPAITDFTYTYTAQNQRVLFTGMLLAWNVSNFTATRTGTRNLDLEITVTRNNAAVTMETRITAINIP